MISPATLAALHRLIAILLALVDALGASVEGTPRPLLARLATGALAISLKRLAAHLTQTANEIVAAQAMSDPGAQPTPDPAPTPHPNRARRIRIRNTPPAPRIVRCPSVPMPEASLATLKIERLALPPQHAHFITIS